MVEAAGGVAIPPVKSLACSGDVTCLAVLECRLEHAPASTAVLLAGIGSQVHAFALPGGRHLLSQTALPHGIRVHGAASCRLPIPGSGRLDPPSAADDVWLVALHGDRHVAVLAFSPPPAPGGAARLRPLCALPRLPHWTMALHLSPGDAPGEALLAVGLSNNSVEVYALAGGGGGGGWAPRLLGRRQSAEQCLLYSMHLHRMEEHAAGAEQDAAAAAGCVEYLVAGGTIFLDVVIWAAEVPAGGPAAEGCSNDRAPGGPAAADGTPAPPAAPAPVLFRLRGHQGSVHSVRWGPGASLLASCSDDRTLRVWDVPPPPAGRGGPAPHVELRPRHVLFGHGARLWGSAFAGDEAVVSASEDCTCRVWDLRTGACLGRVEVRCIVCA
jgi:hypothetical protein